MTQAYLYSLLIVLLLISAIRLLYPGEKTAKPSKPAASTAEFFPVHSRYFPQMRQLFSEEDTVYLAAHGSPALLRRWEADRKRVARAYLGALAQDFAGLNRLARTLARHSAQLQARQQLQVAWLNLRFQLLYRLAVTQLLLGLPVGTALHGMTQQVGSLSGRLARTALAVNASPGALTP